MRRHRKVEEVETKCAEDRPNKKDMATQQLKVKGWDIWARMTGTTKGKEWMGKCAADVHHLSYPDAPRPLILNPSARSPYFIPA